MTRYGTLIAWAKALGRDDCARVLQQTLAEEKAADGKLTNIAELAINPAAAYRARFEKPETGGQFAAPFGLRSGASYSAPGLPPAP